MVNFVAILLLSSAVVRDCGNDTIHWSKMGRFSARQRQASRVGLTQRALDPHVDSKLTPASASVQSVSTQPKLGGIPGLDLSGTRTGNLQR